MRIHPPRLPSFLPSWRAKDGRKDGRTPATRTGPSS
nr:MAG TPA: hypothetical protein [Caudoviricetes sp.]